MARSGVGSWALRRLTLAPSIIIAPGEKELPARSPWYLRQIEAGEHPKIVQEILGHSQISLTLDTYSHVSPGIQEEAIRRLGTLLP